MDVDVQPQPTPTTEDGPQQNELSEERQANKAKFEVELEMLCSLANPHYLHDLSSCGYLEPNSPFLNFVDYLGYWEKPEYAKFILYPQALHHRRLLLQPGFRLQLKIQGATLVQKLADVQFQHWKTWRSEKQEAVPTEGS